MIPCPSRSGDRPDALAGRRLIPLYYWMVIYGRTEQVLGASRRLISRWKTGCRGCCAPAPHAAGRFSPSNMIFRIYSSQLRAEAILEPNEEVVDPHIHSDFDFRFSSEHGYPRSHLPRLVVLSVHQNRRLSLLRRG